MKRTIIIVAAAIGLTACATNQKVAVNQLSDNRLTCSQIADQDAELDTLLEKARHNKGASGANVAAVILFWPAALGNYADADKAEELAVERKRVLAGLYEKQGCS